MRRFQTYLRCDVRLILLGWVALNLVLASIPRCDLIFSAFHSSMSSDSMSEHDHCAPQEKTQAAAINDHRLCACALARLVLAQGPDLRYEPIVTRLEEALFDLEFTYQFALTQHVLSIETPPPRPV